MVSSSSNRALEHITDDIKCVEEMFIAMLQFIKSNYKGTLEVACINLIYPVSDVVEVVFIFMKKEYGS